MGVPFVYPLFLVLLVGLIVFAAVRALVRSRTPGSWVAVAVGLWLVALVFMTVRPGTGLGVRLNLIPILVDGPGSAYDAVRNTFVFVPLGMLLAVAGWRALAALGTALAVSLGIEITQYLTDLGRTADVNDLITNVVGAAIGWAIAFSLHRAIARRRAARNAAVETAAGVY